MIDLPSLASSALLDQAFIYVLVLARVAGIAWTAPAWSTAGMGWRIRAGLCGMVTMAVVPAARLEWTQSRDVWGILHVIPAEVGVGAILGLTAALLVAAARQAGELVGMQAGLSPAALFDPDVADELNPLGHLYGIVAMGAFLAMDGPLKLVGSLIKSYEAIPAGGWELSMESVDAAFGRVGWGLSLAVKAAAPAALALVLAGVALGLLGRAAPSLQMMSLALPIRVAVGMVVVFFGIVAIAGMLATSWAEIL